MHPTRAGLRAPVAGNRFSSSLRLDTVGIISSSTSSRSRATMHQQPQRRPVAAAAAAAGNAATTASPPPPLVKVCGVTNPRDAAAAASAGADLVGMIMWPKAKRAVSDGAAREVAAAARAGGALPVGVFVDEGAAEIERRCRASGLRAAQLHGDGARAALAELDPEAVPVVVYVLHASDAGEVATPLPPKAGAAAAGGATPAAATPRVRPLDLEATSDAPGSGTRRRKRGEPTFLLYDGLQGGGGRTFDWAALLAGARPADAARACGAVGGWALAGGLGPANVAAAVEAARPDVVDVSSGVCGPDGLLKDAEKVVAFVRGAKEALLVSGGGGGTA
jgi:phosphoribosylanthranilate isomerase